MYITKDIFSYMLKGTCTRMFLASMLEWQEILKTETGINSTMNKHIFIDSYNGILQWNIEKSMNQLHTSTRLPFKNVM